jgi:EAL domain-containing protein (putative c-di-GMP-specific phosphodiesterase class I)
MIRTHEINSELIEEAIDNGELLLHYQLQSSLQDNKIVGMEALTRWQSPTFGYVNTAQFIDILEHSEIELIAKFHKWMICTAFTQIVAWRAMGITVPIFLNFSTRYLQQQECLTLIQTMLQEYNLPASCFGVEVTESYSITNMADIKFVLQSLHRMGIQIVLDDFCTSYCTLEYLTELPASKIKIDKQFIQSLGDKSGDKSSEYPNSILIILESVIDMAMKLGIEVIAEGVETVQQLEQVTYLGCDSYQGFLYYPPVPAHYASAMILNSQNHKEYQFSSTSETILQAIAR